MAREGRATRSPSTIRWSKSPPTRSMPRCPRPWRARSRRSSSRRTRRWPSERCCAGSLRGAGASNGPVQPSAEPTETKPAAGAPATNGGNATPVAARIAERSRARRGVDHWVRAARAGDEGRRARCRRGEWRSAAPAPAAADVKPIRGPAATLVKFMNESRSIPTATSFRTVPVDALDGRRKELKAAGKKLSFTHLIAWAIVQAARRHAGDGPRLRRGGREATARDAGQHEPRAGGGRGAQGRHALARGAGSARRQRAQLRRLRGALRRAGGGRARQHPSAGRLPGGEHHAHQPGRHRHRGERAAPDARPGHDRRHRCHRLSAGSDQGRSRAGSPSSGSRRS